jgi:hypothetical protein
VRPGSSVLRTVVLDYSEYSGVLLRSYVIRVLAGDLLLTLKENSEKNNVIMSAILPVVPSSLRLCFDNKKTIFFEIQEGR